MHLAYPASLQHSTQIYNSDSHIPNRAQHWINNPNWLERTSWLFTCLQAWPRIWTRDDQEQMYQMFSPGGGILPYRGLMGTYGQPGYVFLDFCLKQGIFSETGAHNPVLRRRRQTALIFYKCLKLGIKNQNSVLNRVGKSAIFVLNRVRVWGAEPHLPTQGYIEYSPPLRGV